MRGYPVSDSSLQNKRLHPLFSGNEKREEDFHEARGSVAQKRWTTQPQVPVSACPLRFQTQAETLVSPAENPKSKSGPPTLDLTGIWSTWVRTCSTRQISTGIGNSWSDCIWRRTDFYTSIAEQRWARAVLLPGAESCRVRVYCLKLNIRQCFI